MKNVPRRINSPFADYPDVYVVLPAEWLGHHLQRRNDVLAIMPEKIPGEILQVAVALVIADEWGGIPGLMGSDPAKWDFSEVPLKLITWFREIVLEDFGQALIVPKAPSPPSGTTTEVTKTKGSMVGNSETTTSE